MRRRFKEAAGARKGEVEGKTYLKHKLVRRGESPVPHKNELIKSCKKRGGYSRRWQ